MLPILTADDLRVLLDGVGKGFTGFVDSVLRASAGKFGIPSVDVHTNIRGSVQDGGVDSQVERGADDPDTRLAFPSVWQYKARKFSEITEVVIRGEIQGSSKEYARELIRKGYAYRLCVCDDTAPEIKINRQIELNAIIREVYPQPPTL